MTYIDDDVAEGRRCAGLILAQAAQLNEHIVGASCELCHVIEAFSQKLSILSDDLLASTEAYAKSEGETQVNSADDGKRES